jgi:filamin
MQRESQRDRTIMCRYDPHEVGDYIIHVKWSGEHVPGSPFRVQIFDTQEELERFLINNPQERPRERTRTDYPRTDYARTDYRAWQEDL